MHDVLFSPAHPQIFTRLFARLVARALLSHKILCWMIKHHAAFTHNTLVIHKKMFDRNSLQNRQDIFLSILKWARAFLFFKVKLLRVRVTLC